MGKRSVVCGLLLLVVACGSSGGNNNNNNNNGQGTPIDTAVSAPLAAGLTGQASTLTGPPALAAQAAAAALTAGTEASDVTFSASLLSEGSPPDRSAALTSGSARAFGFQLTLINPPSGLGTTTYSGVLLFQSGNVVLAAGASPGASIPPSMGLLLSGGGQRWLATSGQESAQLDQTLASCPRASALPAFITACKVATFTNAGFSITASAPAGGGATGSRTASLPNGALAGVSLTLDCLQTSLCGTGGVQVSVNPPAPTVAAGATQQFTATVTGTSNTAVTWSVVETGGGAVSSSGLYTAPATPGSYHVKATSVADTTKSGQATVTVTSGPPVAVSVSPAAPTVAAGATQQFTATVTGTSNTAVTWSVVETGGGAVSSSGLYTAPAAAGSYHVKATSVADTNKSGQATVMVPAPGITVAISPKPASTTTLGTLGFTATVTGTTSTAVIWTVEEGAPGGRISSAGAYTAPGGGGTFHVRATLQADQTKFDVAPVTVEIGCMDALPQISRVGTSTSEILTIGRIPVKVDSLGRPVVAWVEYAPYTVYVARLEAGAWQLLGPGFLEGSVDSSHGSTIDLAIDSLDAPVVAYQVNNTTSGRAEIHVSRWAGAAWTDFGAVPQGFSNSGQFSLALTASDAPVVVFNNNLTAQPLREIAVAAWNGSVWTETHGIYSVAGDLVYEPSLAIDSSGDVTVAWSEQVGASGGFAVLRPFARKLSGPGAGAIPTPVSSTPLYESAPVLAFDGAGALSMAWTVFPDNMTGNSLGLQVGRFGAGAWATLGPLLPENKQTPHNPHRLLRNPDRSQLGASIMVGTNLNAAVYEYDPASGTWPQVCAPMPDFNEADGKAQQIDTTGLAYDTVNHAYVLAASSNNLAYNQRFFIARIKH